MFTSYLDNFSKRGQLCLPAYVCLGSSLHVFRRSKNSDILVISPEYLVKKDLFPVIEMGGNDLAILSFFTMEVMTVVSFPARACFLQSTSAGLLQCKCSQGSFYSSVSSKPSACLFRRWS